MNCTKLKNVVKKGLLALIYGGTPLKRAGCFIEAARLALSYGKPALYLSIYKGASNLLMEASSKMGLEDLLDKIYVYTSPLSIESLERLLESLKLLYAKNVLSLVAYDRVFTFIYRESLDDLVVKNMLNVAISTVRAMTRKHVICSLLLDEAGEDGEPSTPSLFLKHVDEVLALDKDCLSIAIGQEPPPCVKLNHK